MIFWNTAITVDMAAKEHKEQRAPEPAALHGVEDVGQGDEDQRRALAGIHPKGKGGGEDHKPRHKGHYRIQHGHVDRLAHQAAVTADIAAENGPGTA